MKCTTTREQLLEPITRAEKMTGKTATLPILSCVRCEVSGTMVSITATNLEAGVRYDVPVQDGEDGVVAVSGSVLAQIITSLRSGASVTLSTESSHLLVQSAGAIARIALQDSSEFPTLPEVHDGTSISIPAKALREALQGVAYCASPSTIKPELASVFVHPNGSVLIAAATDSFRLAEKRVPLPRSVDAEPLLIPARSVPDLVRVLEYAPDIVTLHTNQHQLSLTIPGTYLTMRLTGGTFPDYTQIIPKEYAVTATILRFDLERALRRAAVFSDQFNQTTLSFVPKKKQLEVHTENATIGDTTDSVAATLEGEELTIKFNQRYLVDALGPIATDSVLLCCAGRSQPALLRPVGDESFRYVVMPMNR